MNDKANGLLNLQPPGRAKKPRLDFIKQDPRLESMVSKLIDDVHKPANYSTPTGHGDIPIERPSDALVQKLTQTTAKSVTDAQSMFQMLPDLDLAAQILVSSILAPKDMVSSDPIYRVNDTALPSEITGALVSEIETHFTSSYKLKPILSKILEDILFKTGAYPMLVLPESTIDEAINNPNQIALESIKSRYLDNNNQVKSIGLLGNAKQDVSTPSGVSFESFNFSTESNYDPTVNKTLGLYVHDNPVIMSMPRLNDAMRQRSVRQKLAGVSISAEARNDKTTARDIEAGIRKIEDTYYQQRRWHNMPVVRLRTAADIGKGSTGHPTVMKVPAESVIPVHTPSDPENHIGYFIVLDMMGNPLTLTGVIDHYNDLSTAVRRNQSLASQLANTSREFSEDQKEQQMDDEEMLKVYTSIVEGDLKRRLANGMYGQNVEFSQHHEIYRLMLGRAAHKMQTQMLFVPAELMTYMAFDYNNYGIGVSLLDKTRIIGSIRAMMMFARTMSGINNSMGQTEVAIELDPEDPNPSETVEFLFHEYVKNRRAGYPLGASNPEDIINYLQNAGINLTVKGNSRYPETEMVINDHSGNAPRPDESIEEELRDRHLMGIGVTPDQIEAAKSDDLATAINSRSLLSAKRVARWKDMFCECLTEFCVKYIVNSNTLLEKFKEIIEANKKHLNKDIKKLSPDELISEFLNAFEIILPDPDSTSLSEQMDSYNEYASAVDDVIEVYVTSDFIDDIGVGDDVEESIDAIQAALAAYFKRQWLRNNNVMSEINDLTMYQEDGKQPVINMLEAHQGHLEALRASIETYLLERAKSNKKKTEKFEKAMDKATGEEDEKMEQETEGGESTETETGSEEPESEEELGEAGGEESETEEELGGEDEETEGGEETEEESAEEPESEEEETPPEEPEEE